MFNTETTTKEWVIFVQVNSRSRRLEVFCEKGVKNFVKFAGRHLCRTLFFNKVAGLRPATTLKKKLRQRCFPANLRNF